MRNDRCLAPLPYLETDVVFPLLLLVQWPQWVIDFPHCTGFVWQGFGSWGSTAVASVRSCWKLPLCLLQPVPASSKTDPLLAEAEPISDSGSASGITYLRRKTAAQQQPEERSETI